MYGEPVTIEGSELLARALQHETDHLDGVLFIDRLDAATPQAGDARHPRVRLVRRREADRQGLARTAPTGLGVLMRVVFAGTPEVALPALDAIAASDHELVGVVTRPDAPVRPRPQLVPSPGRPARRASSAYPSSSPSTRATPTSRRRCASSRPDCCPVVAYGALLPQSALDIPEHGWVNLHFSVLPAWRGAAPVQHAIWAGDEITGATTFRIVKALDAGPTYGVMTERVRPTDTAGDLLGPARRGRRRTCWSAPSTGSRTARWRPARSPRTGVTFAPKILVDDARVDWAEPAVAVDRRIRACTPGPGAWTTLDGERVKVGPVARRPRRTSRSSPGGSRSPRTPSTSAPRTAPVRLGEVKAFGKKQMDAADWARGVRLPDATRFGEEPRAS